MAHYAARKLNLVIDGKTKLKITKMAMIWKNSCVYIPDEEEPHFFSFQDTSSPLLGCR